LPEDGVKLVDYKNQISGVQQEEKVNVKKISPTLIQIWGTNSEKKWNQNKVDSSNKIEKKSQKIDIDISWNNFAIIKWGKKYEFVEWEKNWMDFRPENVSMKFVKNWIYIEVTKFVFFSESKTISFSSIQKEAEKLNPENTTLIIKGSDGHDITIKLRVS